MRKAVLKRIKFTKNGKMLHRTGGKNHFNAKASRKTQLREKAWTEFKPAMQKRMRAYAGQANS